MERAAVAQEAAIDPADVLDVTDASPVLGRAMKVARALQARAGEEFAKPGNLVEVKFVKGQSLSLTSSRLLARYPAGPQGQRTDIRNA